MAVASATGHINGTIPVYWISLPFFKDTRCSFISYTFTDFKAFPTDLHTYLESKIPSISGITVKTTIYPTYKSVKPISHAAKNFLEWLFTQPPGPVILVGHSMGGLLAAEAATDNQNNPSGYPGNKPSRIVGVVAFDTPYLGMHPHVVISGIASLFPDHENDKHMKSEKEMNSAEKVKIADERVTDDWDTFKLRYQDNLHPGSSTSQTHLSSPSSSTLSIPPSPSPSSHHSLSPAPSPSRSPSPLSQLSFLNKAQKFIQARENHPVVRWGRKHADDLFGASKRWVVERFQFGSCMFDPSGLKDRYVRLVAWNGLWCNYWTVSLPKLVEEGGDKGGKDGAASAAREPEGGAIHNLAESDIANQDNHKKEKTKKEKTKKPKSGHHFVVLPNGIGEFLGGMEKWEQVTIAGVEDEVAAHCGLFIRNQNLDYDGLVEKVGSRVIQWCEEVKART